MSQTETISFQDRLSQIKRRIEGNLSPRFVKIIHGAIRQLEISGIENNVIKVGQTMPEFSLMNQNEESTDSSQLRQDGPLAITFYRGFWCPYCNADMSHLNKYVKVLEKLGARLIAISPEKPEYSRKIIAMQKLDFNVLFDEGNQVADQFGLSWVLPHDLMELYRDNLHINLPLYNGDDQWKLPIPARFLVDTKGTIRYAESSVDYTRRPDPEQMISVLKNL